MSHLNDIGACVLKSESCQGFCANLCNLECVTIKADYSTNDSTLTLGIYKLKQTMTLQRKGLAG